MPKVRWLMLYRFCSKFHALSSSAKILKIGRDMTTLGLQRVQRWELYSRHSVVILKLEGQKPKWGGARSAGLPRVRSEMGRQSPFPVWGAGTARKIVQIYTCFWILIYRFSHFECNTHPSKSGGLFPVRKVGTAGPIPFSPGYDAYGRRSLKVR